MIDFGECIAREVLQLEKAVMRCEVRGLLRGICTVLSRYSKFAEYVVIVRMKKHSD
jgi:hypothetical protein